MIEFFVHGVPVAKGSMRAFVSGHHAIMVNDSTKTKPWQQQVSLVALLNKPPEVWGGAVRIDADFFMPRRGDTPKRATGLRHTRKPDRDKLLRVVQDALKGIFYQDDGQVSDGETSKRYADPGQPTGVLVRVQQLPKEVA